MKDDTKHLDDGGGFGRAVGPRESSTECMAIGVGGVHSGRYSDPDDGMCQWCGARNPEASIATPPGVTPVKVPRIQITTPKMTPEVSELRDAVIFLADAYYIRRDQDIVVAAFRRVANDTSKPFSEEAVTRQARRDLARLETYDALVDELARNYYDTSGSISSVDAVTDAIKKLIATYEAAKL